MDILFYLIFFIFALYGVFSICYEIFYCVSKPKNKSKCLRTIIAEEFEKTEADLRYMKIDKNDEDIIILCNLKNKNSLKTADLLKSEFEFIKVMNKDEYIDYISSITKY